MCGIALSIGPQADPATFRRMLAVLAPRGEVTETHREAGLLAGTRRLRIVDRDRAVQPRLSADGRFLLCYNGEVFNHHELRAELTRLGHPMDTESDTEVLLAAFLAWGEEAVRRLRGEYAFVVVERATGRAYLARDPLGVKPLYWSRVPGCLHLASEVKALVGHGAPVGEVPPGHHGWVEPGDDVRLRPYVDLLTLGEGLPVVDDPDEAALLVRAALTDSIRMRVDTDLPLGVVLSGGLDSSLALVHAHQMHPDCVAVTIGVPESPDVAYARRLAADLGVPHEVVELRPRDVRLAEVREAIRISELTEYGDIINAVVSVPIFRRLRDLGVKVVLTGDGSDELFGGYPMYHQVGPERARRLFLHRIRNLCRTELQRVDRASMGHGVEARVPFLDLRVVELAMRLPLELKLREGREKWIVRRAFADVLPDYVLRRPKNPMSYSSGLHERARLYKPLFARLHRSFGYHLLEPVRRDFDSVLSRCGNDLDRAVAAGLARPDYTMLEHARDLVGAAKWNAAPVVRRLVGPRATRHTPVG
ncbi:Asparagine synthetase B [glutamine-hydrolyzing] [Micromonospora sp. MW-13]|uniref:asparagine synthetase B family protein n=1 Tax=unclassified Micromonospora TaxID=2617518 RepID=UPI000E434E4B|nr:MULTISPECIES: asparagine synthase-related protein [unclassified Micromonospora]MCX4472115.1 asparagine synthase-related protein [Micromonospora sp. NBC_01655]RGC67536.1 Asparagine synthetase B [glutamine-hydrolyzing] [Micromonospora sp. MW-13]